MTREEALKALLERQGVAAPVTPEKPAIDTTKKTKDEALKNLIKRNEKIIFDKQQEQMIAPTDKDVMASVDETTFGQRAAIPGLLGPLSQAYDLFSSTMSDPEAAAKGFASGVGDVATGGNVGPAAAVGTTPGLLGPLSQAYNMFSNTFLGEPAMEPEKAKTLEAENEARMAEAPIASLLGQFAGAIGPGTVGAKTVEGGLNKLGKKFPELVSMLGNTFYGKMITNSLLGAGEASAYAAAKDQEIGLGAIFGGGAGAAGSLGQSLIGSVSKRFLGGGGEEITGARQLVGDFMEGMGTKLDPEELASKAGTYDDMGTLMDVAPGAEALGHGMVSAPSRTMQSKPLKDIAKARATAVPERFQLDIKDAMPDDFKRAAGIISDPRAPETVEAQSRAFFETVQPKMTEVMNASTETFNSTALRARLSSILFEGGSPTPREIATAKPILALLESQAKGGSGMWKTLDARGLWSVRKGLDRELNTAFAAKEPDRGMIRALQQSRQVVNEELQKVPGFSEVNKEYSDEFAYKRAYDLGMNSAGSKKVSNEFVADVVETMNPVDSQGFLEGFSRSLADGMKDANGEMRLARNLNKDQRLIQKVTDVYGADVANDFVKAADKALDLLRVRQTLTSGATGGERGAASQVLAPESHVVDAATFFSSVLGAILQSNKFTSKAAGVGAAGRLFRGRSSPIETDEIVRLLSGQGPEAVRSAVGDINKAKDVPFILPLSLGGLDKALTNPNSLLGLNLGQSIPSTIGLMGGVVPGRANER